MVIYIRSPNDCSPKYISLATRYIFPPIGDLPFEKAAIDSPGILPDLISILVLNT